MKIETTPAARQGRLGRYLVNVVCTLVTLVAVGFILPAAFGLERYVIAGGSMTGTIGLGSVVFDEVVPVSDLRVGDVITYMPPADSNIDNLVTHRIVSIKGDTYRTQGDANPQVDPWTFQLTADTQPRVVAHVPYVGYALLVLQDRDNRMLLIGLPAGLVFLWSMRELVVGLRRKDVEPAAPEETTTEPLVDAPLVGVPALVPTQAGPGAVGSPRHPSRRTSPAAPVGDDVPARVEV